MNLAHELRLQDRITICEMNNLQRQYQTQREKSNKISTVEETAIICRFLLELPVCVGCTLSFYHLISYDYFKQPFLHSIPHFFLFPTNLLIVYYSFYCLPFGPPKPFYFYLFLSCNLLLSSYPPSFFPSFLPSFLPSSPFLSLPYPVFILFLLSALSV